MRGHDHAGRPVVVDRLRVVRARRPNAAHAYEAGVSYAMQRYMGGNAEALAAMRDGSRNVGIALRLRRLDGVAAAPAGLRGALRRLRLPGGRAACSARASASTCSRCPPTRTCRLRASVSRTESAPGAVEFEPPAVGRLAAAGAHVLVARRPGGSCPSASITSRPACEQDVGAVIVSARAFQQADDRPGGERVRRADGLDLEAPGTTTWVRPATSMPSAGASPRSRALGAHTRASVDYQQASSTWRRGLRPSGHVARGR